MKSKSVITPLAILAICSVVSGVVSPVARHPADAKVNESQKNPTQAYQPVTSNPDPQTQPRAEVVVQTGHSSYISSVSFSSDGTTLASGSGDNTIKLWDVESGREIRTLMGHHSDVYS